MVGISSCMCVSVSMSLFLFLFLSFSLCGKSLCVASALSQRRPGRDEMKAFARCSSQPAMLEMFVRWFLFTFNALDLTVALESPGSISSPLFLSLFCAPLFLLFISIKGDEQANIRETNEFVSCLRAVLKLSFSVIEL